MMHFGKSNRNGTFTLVGTVPRNVEEQKNFVVQMHNSLKKVIRVNRVAKMACGMLTFIGWDMEYKG